MKLLLINPKHPEGSWTYLWAFKNIVRDKKALNPPLGLATVAALTPSDWDITIIDENVEPIDWDFKADIVGVCGVTPQFSRQKEIMAYFRRKGSYVVAGGSYASLCPEEYTELADTVISGEAEYMWPQFCADFKKGTPKQLYQETGEVNLKDSPPPRLDLIKSHLYMVGTLQFSRGCPFRCEFCDVIVMFGRKPRTKTLEQVERELDMLRNRGIKRILFVDDNLIGHLPQCRKLLAFLAEYQKRHTYQFHFTTQASINMAADHDLMALFQEAHFTSILIGIESPNEEALLETKKEQNTRHGLLDSIRTIYSYGIQILGSFIIGFDADDRTIFDRQYQFILDAGIVFPTVGLLVALPKTPLFERLQKANRLRTSSQHITRGHRYRLTNVIPLKMTYDEMNEGFRNLWSRLFQDKAIYQRLRNQLPYLSNPPSPPVTLRDMLNYTWRLFVYGILPGGYKRWYYFVCSSFLALAYQKPLHLIINAWIIAIDYQSFASRLIEQKSPQRRLPWSRRGLSSVHLSNSTQPVARHTDL